MAVQLTFAEKIALARGRLNETQEVFGARFNVKPLAVNYWEKGRSTPAPEHLEPLRVLFGQVLNDEDESEMEIDTYQRLLSFDSPIQIGFRLSPHSADRVRLAMEIKRRAG